MANRLSTATSPYLLQHADNPVDWWEWSEEAFSEARRRDVPILLSVGYAACHWCHVMAHESFEDQATADLVNENFVAIKVDREERPDIDAVYMAATHALTGHGGWPMTVFITEAGEPFYAGTYFPPAPRHGLPSFGQLLTAIADTWTNRRESVHQAAGEITGSLQQMSAALNPVPVGPTELDTAAAAVLSALDHRSGGFGGAPKFPPSMTIDFLLRHHERAGNQAALDAATLTLEAMGRGGIYDQLAGGFARYSVDSDWVVPHFEKMLYDNALLLRVYAQHARITGSTFSVRICQETVEFLLSDLRTEQGAFASSLDADTNGVEGLTAVWTSDQLLELLGPEDGAWAADLLRVTPAGTFEHGSSVLQLLEDPVDPARWSVLRRGMAASRATRPQPDRDDKVIASWNGLVIGALAEAGAILNRPDWVAAAETAADFLTRVHLVEGSLIRSSRDGLPGDAAGVLSDYADLADGLLALYQATGTARWLTLAEDLLGTARRRFGDGEGGYFDTADDAAPLVIRPRDPTDGATPSGASALAGAMLTCSALTGDGGLREAAEDAVASAGAVVAMHPRSAGRWLAVAEAMARGPLQIAVAGPAGRTRDELALAARRLAPAGSVIDIGEPDAPGRPLLADRPEINGGPAVYVCRGFVCDRPVTTVDDLAEVLARS